MRLGIGLGVCLGACTLASCVGPAASDAEVCRDAIHRLCAAPRCDVANATLQLTDDCESLLQFRTGCGADDFRFSTPSRDRFLNCRVSLLRAGNGTDQHPNCDDVQELFDRCPDVVTFMGPPQ